MRGTADTRGRIQEIALALFIERGYEATSLREIAEELGFTKAALYYHFKTKEDIVASLAEFRLGRLEELISWASSQPETVERRREIVRRYCDDIYDTRHMDLMRFFERNQTALRDHPTIVRNRELMKTLIGLIQTPGAPLTDRLRRAMALFALHAGVMLPAEDEDLDLAARREASLQVALELVEK